MIGFDGSHVSAYLRPYAAAFTISPIFIKGYKMKPGDLVTRKWKPQYGIGTIVHILGETIVVKWVLNERPKMIFEKKEHLKKVSKGEV